MSENVQTNWEYSFACSVLGDAERVITELRFGMEELENEKELMSEEMKILLEKYEKASATIENQEQLMDKLLIGKILHDCYIKETFLWRVL